MTLFGILNIIMFCHTMIIGGEKLVIYTFIVILIFTFFIIINNNREPFVYWLICVLIGFCLSIAGLILYSVYFWEYYYLRNILFDINKQLWLFIYSLRLSSYTVSRILNIGIALFYYSAICFSISYLKAFSVSDRNSRGKAMVFIWLSFFPTQFVVLYDPYIQNMLYSLFMGLDLNINLAAAFDKFLMILSFVNRVWFYSFVIVSVVNLTKISVSVKNNYLKHKVLGMNISLFILFCLYISIFYWAPETIVILRGNLPAYVNDYSYQTYVALQIYPSNLIYYFYPTLSLFSFAAIIFALYKYNILKFVNLQQSLQANANIKIEQLSSAVSHMVKNKLIEINILIKNAANTDDKSLIMENLKNIEHIGEELKCKLDEMNSKNRQITFHFDIININQAVKSAVNKIKFPSQIVVKTNIPISPLECYADKYHLSEAIINIITNAIEAIGENQGKIDISVYTEQGWNIISITDNGPGIPPKRLKKIFVPFFSTKSTSKNWGIGLTYCYKIMKAHKGILLVDSKLNEGTKFNIMLPMLFK